MKPGYFLVADMVMQVGCQKDQTDSNSDFTLTWNDHTPEFSIPNPPQPSTPAGTYGHWCVVLGTVGPIEVEATA